MSESEHEAASKATEHKPETERAFLIRTARAMAPYVRAKREETEAFEVIKNLHIRRETIKSKIRQLEGQTEILTFVRAYLLQVARELRDNERQEVKLRQAREDVVGVDMHQTRRLLQEPRKEK